MTDRSTWPRVSDVLKVCEDSYANVPAHVLEEPIKMGKEAHEYSCQLFSHLMGECAEPTVTESLQMVAMGLQQWIREWAVKPLWVEREVWNPLYEYVGHPDLFAYLSPSLYSNNPEYLSVIDLKFTQTILQNNRRQVMAYWRCYQCRPAHRAYLVRIDPKTGVYEVERIPREGMGLWSDFLTGLKELRKDEPTHSMPTV